jgi:hypothetical protein
MGFFLSRNLFLVLPVVGTPLECLARVDFANPTFISFAQYRTRPQRARSRLRLPAFVSKRTIGSWSVGAPFQLGAKFGVGRCGGIERTSLISLISEERRTRPHIAAMAGCLWPRRSNTRSL